MSYEETLNNEAAAGEELQKPTKKSRTKTPPSFPQLNEDGTPILDADGNQVWGPEKSEFSSKKPKTPRKPKEPEYQKDEAGEFLLDENGEKMLVPKKTRAPATRRVPTHEASVINVDDAQVNKIAKYSGARKQYAEMLKDGQTILEYLEAGGDKGFLRFYVRDGACSITAYVPASPAA